MLATSGQPEQALGSHLQAYDSFKSVKDPNSAILALLAAAQDQNTLHEPDDAMTACLTAERMITTETPAPTRISAKRDLGWLYMEKGDFEKAVTEFDEERDLARAADDPSDEGYADVALSDTFQLIGSWEDALQAVQDGLQIFKQKGLVAGQASAEAQLMALYSDRTSPIKDFDKAISYYQDAERLGYGPSLKLDVLEVYLQQHKYADAIGLAQSRISECTTEHDGDCQAHTLISLSETQRMAGDLRSATASLQRAGGFVAKSPDFYLRGRLLYGQANLQRSLGKYDEAIERYKQLIALIERVKGEMDPNEQRSLSETYGFIYDELVATLYSRSQMGGGAGRARAASDGFTFSEADKARQFAEAWGRTFIGSMRSELPTKVQEEELSLLVRQQHLRSANPGHKVADAGQEQDTQQRLESDRADFLRRIRSAYPAYAAVAYPETVTIDALPLKSDETLVEFKVTTDATFVWIVRHSADGKNTLVAFYDVPKSRDWFRVKIAGLRAALTDSPASREDLISDQNIFNALFPEQYASALLQSKNIIFIPDDLLFLVPFELLSPTAAAGNFPLIGTPTRYYPSAAAMKVATATETTRQWPEAFLGIGDPITSPTDDRYGLVGVLARSGLGTASTAETASPADVHDDQVTRLRSRGFSFERLPGTATEVRDIAKLIREHKEDAEVRVGLDATKEELLETDLTRFRYLHFATHGILPTDLGIKEPALVLSFEGSNPDNMLLPASEVLKMKLRADSVVLSACNTGSGEVSRAEGVMSLGRAFLSAGASSVTVSLWQVSDESTAVFMTEYYRGLLSGEDKPEALAAARLALFKGKYRDPYYWAPFILIGQ